MHKAINQFRSFAYKISKNNTRTCWVLKCDIIKFFASIDQNILINILEQYVPDRDIVNLLKAIIFSFYSAEQGIGLPLGNLISQLFANVYMNELDQLVRRKLKVKYYIRYADDFVILSENKIYLENLIPQIVNFLSEELKLELHPNKIFIKTLYPGVDFLGWVHFFDHRVLRRTTRKRMFQNIKTNFNSRTLNSYLGLLKHGNTKAIREKIYLLNKKWDLDILNYKY